MKGLKFIVVCFVLFLIFPDISEILSGFFEPPFAYVLPLIIGFFTFITFSLNEKKSNFSLFLTKLFSYVTIGLAVIFFILWANAYYVEKVDGSDLLIFLLLMVLGFFIGIGLDRICVPSFERVRKLFTQKAGTERDLKTDIRDIQKDFESILKYDPRKFFSPDKWFFGLDQSGNPIFFNFKNLLHTQITGASGFGKSVLLGLLAYQAILKREATIIFDPKQGGDEWLPHLCQLAAKILGIPYSFLDVRNNLPQINLMEGMTSDQITNLLITGFLFEDRGDAADFYRRKDRKMAQFVGKNYREGMTLKEISEAYDDHFRKNEADGFADALEELAQVESVNAKQGISLKDAMDHGHVIYIAGDWEDPKHITVQRMLLARIVQIASERDNTLETPKQVCVILDELSFQISKIFGDALKVIRDKGLHFILAHQSVKDLSNVPENMDAQAFAGSVMANCPLKFSYRAVDNETAQYFSEFSGKVLVDDESRSVEKTMSLTDRVVGEKQIRQAERNLIDINTMLSLPPRTGVLFGNGVAKISTVYPIEVEKTADSKKITSFENPEILKKTDPDSPVVFSELG